MPPVPEPKLMLLVENCRLVATFDDAERELPNCDILIREGKIAAIGAGLRASMALSPEVPVIDGRGHVALPGFVNCHHHMFQVLTRSIPLVANAELFDWLVGQYKIWIDIDGGALRAATIVAMAELLLTGCTTTTDHHYLYPVSQPVDLLDEQIRVAGEMGMRFYPTRGSMTLGVRDGGLPPMELVEDDDRVLTDYERLVTTYHDRDPDAMVRIAFAPCSPFNVTERLFRETASLARKHGVRMHTHLAETDDEDRYCMERYGRRPLDFVADLGWEGNDVWFAHCVKLNADELVRCAKHGTAIAHCPSSNCRLGSGIAPVAAMLRAGVSVGIGVDGSASNDSGDMLAEVRQALLLSRVAGGAQAMTTRTALRVATRGGAKVLGNDALGKLEVGGPADLVLIDLEQYGFAGGASVDPLTSVLLCGTNHHVAWSIINGRIVVERGKLASHAEKAIVRACNRATEQLMDSARKRGVTLG